MNDEILDTTLSIRCTGLIKEEIEKMAKEEGRSRGAIARRLWIIGLEYEGKLDRTHTKRSKK